MIPSVEAIKEDALEALDSTSSRFPPAVQDWGFTRAYLTLADCFLVYEIDRIKKVTTYTLPADTAVLTPETAGIADFGEIIALGERLSGSADNYNHVAMVENLPQAVAGSILAQYEWREDAFQFVGSTAIRQLRITYYGSGAAPATGTVGIDGSMLVLSKLTAAFMAPRKGDIELGQALMKEAVGPRFSEGIVGGDALRLIRPMLKSQQAKQVAPRPYRAGWAGRRIVGLGGGFYVAANPAGTGAVLNLIVSGTPDGTDGSDGLAAFTLPYPPIFLTLYRNGLEQRLNYHYTLSGSVITFLAPFIPVAGDLLDASGQV